MLTVKNVVTYFNITRRKEYRNNLTAVVSCKIDAAAAYSKKQVIWREKINK